MKLEDQVCTESQGLRLEELGITARPLFAYCWVDISREDSVKDILLVDDKNTRIPELATTWVAPAFTTAELGEMLPTGFDTMKITIQKDVYGWRGFDESEKDCPPIEDKYYTTEAQARAAMLIYLLENKLTTPEQVNQRP